MWKIVIETNIYRRGLVVGGFWVFFLFSFFSNVSPVRLGELQYVLRNLRKPHLGQYRF